ncbi:MAG: ImmA/IrrE family metallo-endopeptidase [Sphaerochaetaceae bacterium]|nr:ImmA/IrrE family metallo-endopeptidase [Sphaerochaetaceae bacterium]
MELRNVGFNLRRYMKMKKITIPKLAQSCDLGTATISNLLNGKNNPNSKTLLKITEYLGIPFYKLLEDTTPLTSYRFRSNKNLTAREKANRDQFLLDSARWLKDYKILEDLTGKTIRYSLSDYKQLSPEDAAKKARKELNIAEKEPVSDIVFDLEKAGIKVRIVSFGFRQTFGISVGPSDNGPAIFVNSFPGITIERQIFTAAHELGHLLLHITSYDGQWSTENGSEETEADRFASCFLMPEEAFKEKWDEYRGASWIDTILRVKHYFNVSYQTVLHRYCELTPSYNYSDLSIKFSTFYKEEYNHDLKDHYEPLALESTAISETTRFAGLVRDSYENGDISISRAAEMLNLSTMQMRELVSKWTI